MRNISRHGKRRRKGNRKVEMRNRRRSNKK
jgi:hypothetical protein